MPDVNTLLDMAIKEADNLFDGEEFLVKDLFKGYDWEERQEAKSQRAGIWWKSARSPDRVNHP